LLYASLVDFKAAVYIIDTRFCASLFLLGGGTVDFTGCFPIPANLWAVSSIHIINKLHSGGYATQKQAQEIEVDRSFCPSGVVNPACEPSGKRCRGSARKFLQSLQAVLFQAEAWELCTFVHCAS
jgi:hypothetical protein